MKIKVYLPPESDIDHDELRWTLFVVLPIIFSFEDQEGFVIGHVPEDTEVVFLGEPPARPHEGAPINMSVYSDWLAVSIEERILMAQSALDRLFGSGVFDLEVTPLLPKSGLRDEAAVERLRRRVDDTVEHIDDRITEARESQTTLLQELSS